MTVGYHAPLPPARSGAADYAARLLEELRKHGTVNVDAAEADVHVYHLGNNQLHRQIYERAIQEPGVVVLHDAVLQHFYLGAFDEDSYLGEFVFNYGDWGRGYGRELWCERAGSAMDSRYFERPMLKRVAERSLAVVVHNPAAAAAVRRHAPNAQIAEIPHFFERPSWLERNEGPAARAQLNIPQDAFTFAVFGYLRESKRLLTVLQCFEELHRDFPHVRLLVAGSFASSDLARAAEPYLRNSAIIQCGHLEEGEFWHAATSVDACLNLRNPPSGETSGIGIRLMGLSKPVFFTDGMEIANIPGHACVRISHGVEEAADLLENMVLVTRYPQVARSLGAHAAAHVSRLHAIDLVGERYWELLCAARASSR